MITRLILLLAALLCWAAPASAQTIKSLGYNTTNGRIVAATNVVWTNAFNFSTNTVAGQVRTNLGLGWSALTNTNFGQTTNTFVQGNDARIATIASGSITTADGGGSINTTFDSTLIAPSQIKTGSDDGNGSAYQNGGYIDTRGSDEAGGNIDTSGGQSAGAVGGSINTSDGGGSINTRGTGSIELGISETRTTLIGTATSGITVSLPQSSVTLVGYSTNSALTAQSRTNLGLPLPALTNTSNVTTMRALAGSTNTNQPFSGSIALTNTNTLVFSNGILLSQ